MQKTLKKVFIRRKYDRQASELVLSLKCDQANLCERGNTVFIIIPTISRILGVAGLGGIIAIIVSLFGGDGLGGVVDTVTGFFGNLD
jgi:hypothetical protein